MQRLPEALAAAPGIELELGVDVAQIEKTASDRPSAGAYLLLPTAGAPIWADAVILAGPTHVAARLLQRIAPAAANELSAIPVPPIVVVGLGFDPQGARGFPHGFGALVARGEGIRMLGFLLESHIYPGRCPADHLLVRCMFGGSMDPDVIDLDDDEVSSLAARELRALAGVSERPLLSHVVRWPRAIPQYELGHLARRDRIERELDRHPGLYLAGDALAGVSFPKAAAAGVHQARRAIEFLTPPITRTRS